MSLQHFKKLYNLAKEKGINSALDYDTIETLKRHPKLADAVIAAAIVCSKPKPEPEIYVDYCAADDGKYQLRRQGWCPISVAYNNGWISEKVYLAVIENWKKTIEEKK